MHEVDGYVEEKNVNKYLIFASTDKNKEVSLKYTELWNRIKNLIEKTNHKPGKYRKDVMMLLLLLLLLSSLLSSLLLLLLLLSLLLLLLKDSLNFQQTNHHYQIHYQIH